MSRSVATASNAAEVVYLNFSDENLDEFAWDDFVEDVRNVIQEKYPSFSECDTWEGNEVHEILVNQHAHVTISEYCGLVAICLVPREHEYYEVGRSANIAGAWCASIGNNFVKHLHKRYPDSALISQGHASNGEQFFRPVNRPSGMVTSKEGTLW